MVLTRLARGMELIDVLLYQRNYKGWWMAMGKQITLMPSAPTPDSAIARWWKGLDGTIAAALVLGVLILAMLAVGWAGSLSHSSGASTNRQMCEQKWDENRTTADQGYMTRDRYIANCMATNERLN